jgi:hypothetical protein
VSESSVKVSKTTEQMFERPIDRLGRVGFRKMGLPLILKAAPSLMEHFAEVPAEFWALDVGEDGFSVAQVSCPCSDTHEVAVGHVFEAPCERFFFALPDSVLVANSPTSAA